MTWSCQWNSIWFNLLICWISIFRISNTFTEFICNIVMFQLLKYKILFSMDSLTRVIGKYGILCSRRTNPLSYCLCSSFIVWHNMHITHIPCAFVHNEKTHSPSMSMNATILKLFLLNNSTKVTTAITPQFA